MVPGQRLPLGGLGLWVGLGLGLTACPAEQLGVELPRGGVEAVSPEDLRRDAGDLEAAPSPEAAGELLARRLAQMRLLPAFGSAWTHPGPGGPLICGRKEGQAPRALLVVAIGAPNRTEGAVAWAGLISLAKAWDRPGRPPRTILLCALVGTPDLEALAATPPQPLDQVDSAWILESLHGPAVSGQPRELGPLSAERLYTDAAVPADVGAVDHRIVAVQLRAAFARITGDGN